MCKCLPDIVIILCYKYHYRSVFSTINTIHLQIISAGIGGQLELNNFGPLTFINFNRRTPNLVEGYLQIAIINILLRNGLYTETNKVNTN